jgi:CheY-like chemotaxis protein
LKIVKPKIPIVDDDSAHRKMLEIVFSTDRYDIRKAEDGQAAVDAVEESFYDLILMDIHMGRIGR